MNSGLVNTAELPGPLTDVEDVTASANTSVSKLLQCNMLHDMLHVIVHIVHPGVVCQRKLCVDTFPLDIEPHQTQIPISPSRYVSHRGNATAMFIPLSPFLQATVLVLLCLSEREY